MSRHHRPRYRFPNWNYGYTLGPPVPEGTGDYSTFVRGPRPRFAGPPHPHPQRPPPPLQDERPKEDKSEEEKTEVKSSDEATNEQTSSQPEEGQIDDTSSSEKGDSNATSEAGGGEVPDEPPPRSLNEILGGKNPIMHCNDQAKYRGLPLEWEQVSETGPPHDKTFTWSLKIGDMTTTGSSNSKKGAKNKAAEEMALKLDKLPRPQKRPYHSGPGMMPPFPMYRMPYPGPGFYPPRMPPPWVHHQMMKRRRMEMDMAYAAAAAAADGQGEPGMPSEGPEGVDGPPPPGPEGAPPPMPVPPPVKKDPPKLLNPSQNNPISKLYEYCKKYKLPEPIFTTVKEEILNSRKTQMGFTMKKTEFTIECSMQGKTFSGKAMNKKQAKYNAAAAAWADFGAGVDQASIQDLLKSQRSAT